MPSSHPRFLITNYFLLLFLIIFMHSVQRYRTHPLVPDFILPAQASST
jgi:hypothetical protein